MAREGTAIATEQGRRRSRGGRSQAALAAAACALSLALAGAASRAAGDGDEELTVRISHDGFAPDPLRLHRGETYRLTLHAEDGEHCFGVAELRIEKRVRPGKDTQLVLTAPKAGRFRIYCCVESGEAAAREVGTLVVVD